MQAFGLEKLTHLGLALRGGEQARADVHHERVAARERLALRLTNGALALRRRRVVGDQHSETGGNLRVRDECSTDGGDQLGRGGGEGDGPLQDGRGTHVQCVARVWQQQQIEDDGEEPEFD
eukprot:jgi/Chrpa1/5903/Chrysochromulina_OHIO_Genome00016777-RA